MCSVYLAAGDGTALPAARAGQYLTLRVTGAAQPVPVRSYSLSSAPDAGTYRISVKREPHGVASGWLHQHLKPGALLEVAAPRGEFTLDDGTGPVLLISAGIGVTPVLAMLHQLAAAGSEREVWWLYGARGPDEHPFAAEAHALLASLPHAREHIFYSAATPAERHRAHAAPAGSPGRGSPGCASRPPRRPPTSAGLPSFMTGMRDALTALGTDPARIFTELFGALDAINPGLTGAAPPAAAPAARAAGHRAARSPSPAAGSPPAFGDAWRSVLDLADACDVPTRWSCRTGVCHTCVTPLLSGDISYAPDPLEPPPDGQILICCAQPAHRPRPGHVARRFVPVFCCPDDRNQGQITVGRRSRAATVFRNSPLAPAA